MTSRHRWLTLVSLAGMLALGVPRAYAADPPAPADPVQQAAAADNDATPQLAEPDYRLINLPTTLRLPTHGSNFDLTHRFNGNLARKSFSEQAAEIFGLDDGAAIGIEYRFGIVRHVQAIVYRTSIDKTFQFYGKIDALHQRERMPLSLSGLVSVEGANNFQERYLPSLGLTLSRAFGDRAAVYATPIWVHNTAALLGVDRDTGVLGIGGRVRVLPTVYVAGEVMPRIGGYSPGKPEFAFALEKRAGLHMFQLNLGNSQATTFGQLARGGFADSLYLGFNLARKFF